MKVDKSNLVAMLLARSLLPDEVDTERDGETLVSFGLERDQIDEIALLAVGVVEPEDVNTRRRRDHLQMTISRRWADLVEDWVSE